MSSSLRVKWGKNAGESSAKSVAPTSRASSRAAGTTSGSSQPAEHGAQKNESIVRYTLKEIRKLKRRSDIAFLLATTEDDIARQISEDPDLQGFDDIDWAKAVFVPATKRAISIRLDADILEFFKAQGSGYQSRINKVLRHYVESVKKPAE
jgi:uncharacterized protein (DUF4415 family)